MNPPLSAGFPLKMFYDICDVGLTAVNTGLFKSLIEQTTGGSDKGFALKVFLIPRLFADEQNLCAAGALAKDGLSCVLPKIACLAVGGRLSQRE